MGCDIHMYTEIYSEQTEKWISFDFFEVNPYFEMEGEYDEDWREPEYRAVEFDDDRCYEKFSILSYGVRGEPDGPVAASQGFPEDANEALRTQYKQLGCDAHSANHMTVTEFHDLVAKYRLLQGDNSPLKEMHEKLNDHIRCKLKYEFKIKGQNYNAIRLVYWFDN